MAQTFKFINLNAFPIFLPCDRGGQVMFRPGEGTTKQWFSRFCGKGQLTRTVLDTEGKTHPILAPDPEESVVCSTSPMKDVNVKSITNPPLRPDKKSFPDEETDDYSVKDGVYRCKLCDKFMSGARESMQTHIASYHGKAIPIKQDAPADLDETVVATSRQSTPQPAASADDPSAESDIPTTPASPAPEPPKEEEPAEVFRCTHAGCNKEFKSNRGLSMHTRRVHG